MTTEAEAAAALFVLEAKARDSLAASSAVARLTSVEIDAIVSDQYAVEVAAEDFRARFYPRAARVACAGGLICTVSPTGRSIRTVAVRGA